MSTNSSFMLEKISNVWNFYGKNVILYARLYLVILQVTKNRHIAQITALVFLQKDNLNDTCYQSITQENHTSHTGVKTAFTSSAPVFHKMWPRAEGTKEKQTIWSVLWLPQKNGDRPQLCFSREWFSL